MFTYYIVFPLAACIGYLGKPLSSRMFTFLFFALTFKIVMACVMTYLLINQYDYGDYRFYFDDAIDLASDMSSVGTYLRTHLLSGVAVPVILNATLFNLFPPSLYGLALISGCSSFLYCFLLARSFEKLGQLPVWAVALLYFSPVLSLQAGYTGKETYLLPLLGLAIHIYVTQPRLMLPKLALVLVGVALIRPYQVAFLILPMMATWVLFWRTPLKYPLFLVGALGAVAGLLLFAEQLSFLLRLEATVGTAYEGGSLMLAPWVFPLSLLQSFRPFPWEAHNMFALLASLEYLAWLAALVIGVLFLRRLQIRGRRFDRAHLRLLAFAGISLATYMLVFQFNENMGDLARRHVYYYPLVLALLIRPRWPSVGRGCADSHDAASFRSPMSGLVPPGSC